MKKRNNAGEVETVAAIVPPSACHSLITAHCVEDKTIKAIDQ